MSNLVEPQPNVEKVKQEQPEEIRIEVITREDTDEILAMLKEYFFKVGPSSLYLHIFTFMTNIGMDFRMSLWIII